MADCVAVRFAHFFRVSMPCPPRRRCWRRRYVGLSSVLSLLVFFFVCFHLSPAPPATALVERLFPHLVRARLSFLIGQALGAAAQRAPSPGAAASAPSRRNRPHPPFATMVLMVVRVVRVPHAHAHNPQPRRRVAMAACSVPSPPGYVWRAGALLGRSLKFCVDSIRVLLWFGDTGRNRQAMYKY